MRALSLREEIPLIDWMRLTSNERKSEVVESLSEGMRSTRNSRTMQSGEKENHQGESNRDEEESIRLEDLEGCCGEQASEI